MSWLLRREHTERYVMAYCLVIRPRLGSKSHRSGYGTIDTSPTQHCPADAYTSTALIVSQNLTYNLGVSLSRLRWATLSGISPNAYLHT